MSKSKTPVTQSVTGVGIELSQTKVWTAKNYILMQYKLEHLSFAQLYEV